MTERTPDDYDSPWKEALEHYLPEFMAFYFPAAEAAIDWQPGHHFLDQELRQIVREAALGKQTVDKLVEVTRRDGEVGWVYIHIEVQSQRDPDFARRLFSYHSRIYQRYARPVASLAVLADTEANWRPQHFGYELFGCRLRLDFPVAKLLDWQDRIEALLAEDNVFAWVTAAHLLTQRTRDDAQARYAAKWRLIRLLYQRNWDRPRILELLVIIDWLLHLPAPLAQRLRDDIERLEEETHMRYVTSFEREAEKRGQKQGQKQGEATILLRQMERKFGTVPEKLRERIQQTDAETLLEWSERILTAETPEDVVH